jgi:hypothetical protein
MADHRSADLSSPISQLTLRSNRLLLVEGPFDQGFLHTLLIRSGRAGVQVEPIGGRYNRDKPFSPSNLTETRASVRAWSRARGAERLTWVGIALDADLDADASFRSARAAIQFFSESRIPVPNAPWEAELNPEHGCSSSIFVFPKDQRTGDIEKQLWEQSFRSTAFGVCIDAYIDCILASGAEAGDEWKARINCLVHADPSMATHLRALERGTALAQKVDPEVFRVFWEAVPED